MSVATIGGVIVGGTMLLVGIGILASEIDPLLLCFKQCEVPRALVSLFGSSAARLIAGTTFLALAALFLVPLLRGSSRGSAER